MIKPGPPASLDGPSSTIDPTAATTSSQAMPNPVTAADIAGGVPQELFRLAPIPILVEDWSEVKRRIDALRESGVADLDAYIEANPGLIDELRRLHSIVDANEATLSLFEADSKEIFHAWSRQLLPADRFSNSQVLRGMLLGHTSCQGERTLTSLKGRKVPIVWRCALPDKIEQYRRLHFYAFDVTEYKENSARLDALRAEMAHSQRVSTVDQLVASITHEIGQPLAAIRTAIEAAIRWLGRKEPHVTEAVAALRNAARWTDDTTEICRRLRGFLGNAPIQARRLDCAEIIESAMLLVAPEANAKSISLRKEVEPGLTAFADHIHVQQVLTNLLINSVHAIAARGRDGEAFVRVRAVSYSEMHVLFEVVDSGCGIDSADPQAVFQPFLSTKRDGMGMGLPISKSIVESHGGKIWVGSTGKTGTRFCFTLPRPETAANDAVDVHANDAGTLIRDS
ncbi:sensor histidine kinase [Paraburkholderia sp. BR10923]|uniref:sensor histidine kinase n=1 Tax=Paraburkholderia sp. BR10923 TaxID=3236992 RepID=UPI0034CE84F9